MFTGQFWDRAATPPGWEADQNVIITIDTPDWSVADVLPYFTQLRDAVNAVYRLVGQPQKALWITAQQVFILWG